MTQPAESTSQAIIALRRQVEEGRDSQRKLLRAAQRFQRLVETERVFAWEAALPPRRFTFVGPEVEAVLGYPVSQWHQEGFWAEHLHEADRERALSVCRNSSRTLERWDFEYRMVAADGREVWMHDVVSAIRENDRALLRGFMIDITDRKNAQLELEQTHRELRRVSDQQRTLLELAHVVSSHRRREDLFHAIAVVLEDVVPLDRLVVLLPRNEPSDLQQLYAVETKEDNPTMQAGMTYPIEGTAPGWVIRNRKIFIGSSLEDLKPFGASYDVLRRQGLNSNCLLPLIAEGRVVGVLGLMSKTAGNFDSLDRDFMGEIGNVVAVALDNCLAYEEISHLRDRLAAENVYLREEIRRVHNFEEIVGSSPPLMEVLATVEAVAPTDATVLIHGETGVGKELIARAIHDLSGQAGRALVKVNCAAISSGLVESELFGHVKGAFTGAVERRAGRFELADRGSLFLDEVAELPEETQVKLLRVLQDGEFEPVGSSRTRQVKVRVIAATNRNLEEEVHQGRFRSDLYYRLNVLPILVPPLRERRSDILQLAMFFFERAARRFGKKVSSIAQETIDLLTDYDWPGNVRELQNVIERAVVLAKDPTITIDSRVFGSRLVSPGVVDQEPSPVPVSPDRENFLSLEGAQRHHILVALRKTGGVIEGERGAAKLLGIRPSTLRSRMKKLTITTAAARSRRQTT